MIYRRKSTPVQAIQISKGMEIPEWLSALIRGGYLSIRGTCPYTKDAPYAVDEISKSYGIEGEFIVLEYGRFTFMSEERFYRRFEPMENE